MGISTEAYARASTAETDHLNMCRLQRMDQLQFRRLFAGNPARALPLIESAARSGVAEAQLRLGQMRLDGVGADQDAALALHWFERAARRGSPEAMNMAGRCHENGWGVEVEFEAAARWYRMSAEAGHDWGEYNLGHMYFDGRGVSRDETLAMSWYLRAASQGHARAMNLAARCYEEGWGVGRAPLRARHWYRRSAEGGYFRGQFNFAMCLAAEARIEEALDWLDRAWRSAAPDGLAGMAASLIEHPDPRLAAFGREAANAGAPHPPR